MAVQESIRTRIVGIIRRLVVKATGKVLGKTALGGVQVPPLNTRPPWIKLLPIRIEKPNWLR